MDEQQGVGGSSEHVHYGATTLPLMRTSCLPEHTLQAACSFRVTHSAEGIDQPRVQRLHTHTHTVSHSFTSCLPNNVAHLAAADFEEAANYLLSSFTSSCTNSLCFLKNFNNPIPELTFCVKRISITLSLLHHKLTFCVHI